MCVEGYYADGSQHLARAASMACLKYISEK